MTIEIKTVIRYEYKCLECGNDYTEQRNPGEEQFINKCPVCSGGFNIISTTESTYEVEILDVTEEAQLEVISD